MLTGKGTANVKIRIPLCQNYKKCYGRDSTMLNKLKRYFRDNQEFFMSAIACMNLSGSGCWEAWRLSQAK